MNILVLGAGQLAQMMALAGKPLNINTSAYDVTTDTIVDPVSKAHLNGSLADALKDCDVVTAEFEHIPLDILDTCEQSDKLFPSAQAIKTGGDRRTEKNTLDNAGVNNAAYHIVKTKSDYLAAIDKLGFPLVLKSALSGYDGKGQWRLTNTEQQDMVWQEVNAFLAASEENQAMVAEQFVAFDREVSLVGCRDKHGNVRVYPLVENIHTNGVLSVSLAFQQVATANIQQQATDMFTAISQALNYVGVLAVEFFEKNGQLLVNEIAPRVHNSGHWSQQGAETSQFENHYRAVCNLPLGSTELLRSTCMINVLGEDSLSKQLLAIDGVKMHWYGKSKRAGRKMGHINVAANSDAELKVVLKKVAPLLDDSMFPALHQLIKTF